MILVGRHRGAGAAVTAFLSKGKKWEHAFMGRETPRFQGVLRILVLPLLLVSIALVVTRQISILATAIGAFVTCSPKKPGESSTRFNMTTCHVSHGPSLITRAERGNLFPRVERTARTRDDVSLFGTAHADKVSQRGR